MTSAAVTAAVGWALVHFLWQGAVVAALLAIVLATLRRRPAHERYWVRCGALGLMAAAPLATFTWALATASPSGPAGVAAPTIAAAAQIAPSLADQVLPWIVGLWSTGASLLSLRVAAGCLQVLRLRRSARMLLPVRWQRRFEELAREIGVQATARLADSAAVVVPSVIGWFRPVVLVPARLLTGLSDDQIEALLAHELAHVRRLDTLVGLLQAVVEALLFYHPAVWWVSRGIREEREFCCDDVAVAVTGEAIPYARALTALEDWRRQELRLAASSLGGTLMERIERLVGRPEGDRRRAGAAAGWLLGASAVAAFALTALPAAAQCEKCQGKQKVEEVVVVKGEDGKQKKIEKVIVLRGSDGELVEMTIGGEDQKIDKTTSGTRIARKAHLDLEDADEHVFVLSTGQEGAVRLVGPTRVQEGVDLEVRPTVKSKVLRLDPRVLDREGNEVVEYRVVVQSSDDEEAKATRHVTPNVLEGHLDEHPGIVELHAVLEGLHEGDAAAKLHEALEGHLEGVEAHGLIDALLEVHEGEEGDATIDTYLELHRAIEGHEGHAEAQEGHGVRGVLLDGHVEADVLLHTEGHEAHGVLLDPDVKGNVFLKIDPSLEGHDLHVEGHLEGLHLDPNLHLEGHVVDPEGRPLDQSVILRWVEGPEGAQIHRMHGSGKPVDVEVEVDVVHGKGGHGKASAGHDCCCNGCCCGQCDCSRQGAQGNRVIERRVIRESDYTAPARRNVFVRPRTEQRVAPPAVNRARILRDANHNVEIREVPAPRRVQLRRRLEIPRVRLENVEAPRVRLRRAEIPKIRIQNVENPHVIRVEAKPEIRVQRVELKKAGEGEKSKPRKKKARIRLH